MLTRDALSDRYWRAFPELRRVLEGLHPADEMYRTSVEETSIEQVGRLLSIATVATENADSVLSLAQQGSAPKAAEELKALADELSGIGRAVEHQSERVMRLVGELLRRLHERR